MECRVFLPLVGPVEFNTDYILNMDPYVLGVWLGDGHSADGRVTSDDPEIFEWFPYVVEKQSGKYLYGVKGLFKDLKHLGLINNKHVPSGCLTMSIKDRLALLQGLMDTDGTCHQDGNIAYFCNTNRNLIQSVVELVRGLGGVAVVNENETMCNGKMFDSWRVSVKMNFNPFRMSRKADQWKGPLRMRNSICDISEVGMKLSRCITVENEDGLYVTDDYIVTHNSTALTHDYGLAVSLFREQDFIIIVSNTEGLAVEHLSEIAKVFRDNDEVRQQFGVESLPTDNNSDLVVQFTDGHQCRFIAKGSGQKMRGLKWNGKRPGLILCDDLEDDAEVESKEMRDKFSRWFNRALIPCLRRGGKIRMHGTVLHEGALLASLMKSKSWKTKLFKAHKAFDDFSEILWPEQFPEERLREIRQKFIDSMDAAGYAQEYLNDPLDNSEAYLKKPDFLPMSERDFEYEKVMGVGCDFAVSTKDKANRTSFTVGGRCARNLLHYMDQFLGRWDTLEWIDKLFEIQEKWDPAAFFVEDGVIWKSVEPMINREMLVRNKWMNFVPIMPIKDKATRGRSLQKRMRAQACRFDKDSEWYPGFEDELLRFTGKGEAIADDQFDSAAILSKGLEDMAELEEDDFLDDEELYSRRTNPRSDIGRSAITGY